MTGPVDGPGPLPGEKAPGEFEEEIRAAVRYEKGLAVQGASIALAIVAIVVLIRLLFLG